MFRLATADIEDAGTDDDVVISLNPINFTWLDSPADDFERGAARRQHLIIVRVAEAALSVVGVTLARQLKRVELGTSSETNRTSTVMVRQRRVGETYNRS